MSSPEAPVSGEGPTIPIRTSSIVTSADNIAKIALDINRRRLATTASREQLKRKRSSESVSSDVVKQARIEAELLDVEWDEAKITREEVLMHKIGGLLTTSEFKKKVKAAEKAIDETGKRRWDEWRRVRQLRVEKGELEELSIDRGGTLAALLMKLYVDPIGLQERSSSDPSYFRSTAIELYGAEPTTKEVRDLGLMEPVLWCPITAQFHPESEMKAAHILPFKVGVAFVDYLFAPGHGARLMEADNCLMIHRKLEESFAKAHFVLMPVDPAEMPPRRWKAVVTDPNARNKGLFAADEESRRFLRERGRVATLSDVNGRELKFRTGFRPAARFVYFHFVTSLLRLRAYDRRNWHTTLRQLCTGKPWPTLGRYLRRLVLMKLAVDLGDVDDEVSDIIMGTTYISPTSLDEKEKSEYVRRLKAVFDSPKEDDCSDASEDD